jgi:hypothetical protein
LQQLVTKIKAELKGGINAEKFESPAKNSRETKAFYGSAIVWFAHKKSTFFVKNCSNWFILKNGFKITKKLNRKI